MQLLGKQLPQLAEADLQELVKEKIAETDNKQLEYKQELPRGTDEEMKEFLADIVSFATIGGAIFYGIDEERDSGGKPTGVPASLPGLPINADQEILRLDHVIRAGIDPQISGIHFHPIKLANGNIVLAIEIPRSWNGPHAVDYRKRWRFYGRDSGGKHPLNVAQVRDAIIGSVNLSDRARNFRQERFWSIGAGGAPMPLSDGAKLLMHLIPLQAFIPGYSIDITDERAMTKNFPPLTHGFNIRYNLDGLLFFREASGYVQIYRSGIVEAVDIAIVRGSGRLNDRPFIPSGNLVPALVSALGIYLKGMTNSGIYSPVLCGLTLMNVKGYILAVGRDTLFEYPTIDRDVLQFPELLINDFSTPPADILKPALDALWNSGGYPRCHHYDEDGKYLS